MYNELKHYRTLGQKWGIRRYQNPDGTLTDAGKKRYGYSYGERSKSSESARDYKKSLNRMEKGLASIKSEKARAEVRMQKAANKGNQKRFDKNKAYRDDLRSRENALTETISSKAQEASEKGYSVSNRDVTRFAQKGRVWLRSELAPSGLLGGLILTAIDMKRYGTKGAGVIDSKKWDVINGMPIDYYDEIDD